MNNNEYAIIKEESEKIKDLMKDNNTTYRDLIEAYGFLECLNHFGYVNYYARTGLEYELSNVIDDLETIIGDGRRKVSIFKNSDEARKRTTDASASLAFTENFDSKQYFYQYWIKGEFVEYYNDGGAFYKGYLRAAQIIGKTEDDIYEMYSSSEKVVKRHEEKEGLNN